MNELSRLRALAVLSALAALVACGGSDDDPVAAAPTPAPAPGPAPAPAPGADTQAPVAALTAPAAFASGLTGTLALTATATDNVGIAGVEFQVDGVKQGATLTTAPYTASVDSTQFASGQHIVRVRATDAAGNVSPWASSTVSFGGSRTQPAGFTRSELWVSGLGSATALTQAGDGRWFIATQNGALRVVKNGALLTPPFVQLSVENSGERGLLGVALHPNFATNGFVYVYYTTTENGIHNRVSRFTANGDVAAAGSEVKVFDLPTLSATNHNGGAIHFGSDGKLYVGVGENAVPSNSQSLTTPLGKLLRLNDDGTIPTDNPFYTTATGNARAAWAIGLRNPYTFAVQPGTGRIHINDVGQGAWEEINLGTAGANYGWPASEGGDGLTSAYTAPLFAYGHSAASPAGSGPGGFFTGIAIAGGAFYPSTGGTFPAAYAGNYFFADFGSTFIARQDLTNNAVYAFGKVTGSPVDMAVGADGALYVLTRDAIARFSAP